MSECSEIVYAAPLSDPPVRCFIESHYRHQGRIDWQCLEGTDFIVCDCPVCGLLYQKHVPNNDFLNTLYNEIIGPAFLAELETSRLTVDRFEEIAGELAWLFRALRKHPTEIMFLDFGMGHGRWARIAVAMGAQVYATEISPEKIAAARKLGIEPIDEDTLSEMRFDMIHTEQVFEHLTEPSKDFQRLAKALASDGIMKVAVPSPGRIRRRLKTQGMIDHSPQEGRFRAAHRSSKSESQDYVSIAPLEHLNAYFPKTIAYLAERNGMQLAGRVRRQSVTICASNSSLLTQSLFRLLKVSLRPLFRRNSGYYLLARNSA